MDEKLNLKVKKHFDELLKIEQEGLSQLLKLETPTDNELWKIQLLGMRVVGLEAKIKTLKGGQNVNSIRV